MARDERTRPIGMGGWLAIFVVTLVLGALANAAISYGILAASHREQVAPMRWYFDAVAGSCIAAAVSYTCIAWLLLARQRPGTVQIVVAGLWLAALLPLIGGYLGQRLFFGDAYLQDNYYVVLGPKAFGPFVYAAIATAYLLRSKRVGITYAPREPDFANVFR